MKKGIVIRAFSENPDFLGSAEFLASTDDFLRCFDQAKEAGFDGVQLYVERTGHFSLESKPAIAEEIASGAAKAGIALASLEIAPFSFSFTDDAPEVRKDAQAVVTKSMEIAASMGMKGVLVIPGYVGLPWDPECKPVQYDVAYQRTKEGLTELAPTAEKLGVAILIENVWNMMLLSPMELKGLVDEIGSKRVGVLFDTGNVIQFGYPEQWIRILGERIQEVHLKDFRRAVGTIEGFVGLLEGDVNWPEVMKALQKIKYDGFLTAEMFPYKHHGDTILEHTSLSMDKIMGRA